MYNFYFHLFFRVWLAVISAIGTTTLAVVVFTIVVPILIWLAVRFVGWRRNMSPLKTVFKESLPSAITTALITLLVWIIIFACFGLRTVYDDYVTKDQQITFLKEKIDTLERKNNKDKEAREIKTDTSKTAKLPAKPIARNSIDGVTICGTTPKPICLPSPNRVSITYQNQGSERVCISPNPKVTLTTCSIWLTTQGSYVDDTGIETFYCLTEYGTTSLGYLERK